MSWSALAIAFRKHKAVYVVYTAAAFAKLYTAACWLVVAFKSCQKSQNVVFLRTGS